MGSGGCIQVRGVFNRFQTSSGLNMFRHDISRDGFSHFFGEDRNPNLLHLHDRTMQLEQLFIDTAVSER